MANLDFDLAIVGASLSGSIAAMSAASSGAKIALIDRDNFPRQKVCGEGLSEAGMSALTDLGLSVPSAAIAGYRVLRNNSKVFLGEVGEIAGYGVQRTILDNLILTECLNRFSSVTPLLGVKVRDAEQLRDSVRLRFDNGSISARKIIIADGANSLLSRRLNIGTIVSRRKTYGAGVSCSVDRTPNEVEVVVKNGYEIYVTPVGPRLIKLSFLATRENTSRLLREPTFSEMLKELSDLISLEIDPKEEVIGVGAIASLRRPAVFGNVMLVGDACESHDPVSGMGMTHAILTGQLAGRSMHHYFGHATDWGVITQEYASQQRVLARRLRGYTRAAHMLIRHLSGGPILKISQQFHLPTKFRRAVISSSTPVTSNILSLYGY